MTTGKLADQSVTLEKLAPGVVLAPGNITYVAKTGGHYADPVAAMNALSDWCPLPSTSRCLVKVLPGTYDIGDEALEMADFVIIEGSGERSTLIRGTRDAGVVIGAIGSELRRIAVQNVGSGPRSVAIYVGNTKDFNLRHVTASVSSDSGGEHWAIHLENVSYMLMTHVTASAVGVTASAVGGTHSTVGIYNVNSNPTLDHVDVFASSGGDTVIGLYNDGPGFDTTVKYSKIEARASQSGTPTTLNGMDSTGTGTVTVQFSLVEGGIGMDSDITLRINHSQLSGGVEAAGTRLCGSTIDENFADLSATCD